MSVSFRPGRRENVSLLIGLAGGTGSGKTMSAMLLAKGLAGGQPFAVIDTEAGRALHYADDFAFEHADLTAPFRPDTYADAIDTADKAGYPVIVVDSFSHEHAGDGGLLDWHEEEFQRMGGRDAVKMTAWIKPKMAHKAMVNRLLQVRAHLILCFRAEEKIEIVKVDGKTEVRPKRVLTGLDGWVPVCEKTLPYELTVSFLLTADAPGVPKPIKLPDRLRSFFPFDKPVGEPAGAALGEWAHGTQTSPELTASPGEEVGREAPLAPDGTLASEPPPADNLFDQFTEAELQAAQDAAGYRVTLANKQNWAHGKTLAEIRADDRGAVFFAWALSKGGAELKTQAAAYCRVQMPELLEEVAA